MNVKKFFNDYFKAIALLAASITYLINNGQTIDAYLVDHNIISYTDEGIVLPFFSSIRIYLIISLVLAGAGYVWMLYKAFTNELNTELTLFIMWITFCLSVLYSLSQPTSWFGIALYFSLLFLLFWALVRYVWFSINEYN